MKPTKFRQFVPIAWFVLAVTAFVAERGLAQTPSPCDQLQQLLDQYKQIHDACLAAHQNEPQVPETSEICSHPACQAYHSYVYGQAGQALIAKIAACRHAEQYAQAAADEQKRIDADQAALYGSDATNANNLADQYNKQADGVQPYTMSNTMAQDIDRIHDAASSLSAQQDDSNAALSNDGTVSADNYMPDTASSDNNPPSPAATRDVLDQGIENVAGQDAYQYSVDVRNIASGDPQQQLDGTFDLADKANDNFNSGPSKNITHTLLPKLHNVYSNALNLLDATGHAVTCITSTSPDCTDASAQLDKQWNQFTTKPFGSPNNDWSNIFAP